MHVTLHNAYRNVRTHDINTELLIIEIKMKLWT